MQHENSGNEKTDNCAGDIAKVGCAHESSFTGDGQMGSELSQRIEDLGQGEENQLIDFLYRDMSRINSLVSQLFQGALTGVTTTSSHANQDCNKLRVGLPMLHGDNSVSRTETDSVQKTYVPHDINLVELLSNLQSVLNGRPLSDTDTGRLCILTGGLTIRDYRTLKQTAPIMFENKEVQDGINPTNKKQGREIAKLLGNILKIVPMGIEFELSTVNGESVIGAAKPDCFVDNVDDIARTFGTSMPGSWSILGITDRIGLPGRPVNINPIRKSMDDLAIATRAMYGGSDSQHAIIPILIYRRLHIE